MQITDGGETIVRASRGQQEIEEIHGRCSSECHGQQSTNIREE